MHIMYALIMAAVQLYYYGAIEDRYDEDDRIKVYKDSEIPRHPSVDLREYVVRVYDQGHLHSCTANVLCAAYSLDLKKQELTLGNCCYFVFNPSRLFLYYNTREREGETRRDLGASIRECVKALNCKGVCKESDWPYDISHYDTNPPPRCYESAEGNTLCEYKRLNQDIDQLRACLKDDCPFVFGFRVYQSFHDRANSHAGMMSMPTDYEISSHPLGKHAAVAVGYDDRNRRIIVLNSWGRDWGNNGYFFMPYDFIIDSKMCFDFWKITFAYKRGKHCPNVKCDTCACGSGAKVVS